MKKWIKFGIVNFVTTLRMIGIFLLIPAYLVYGGVALGLTNIACFLTDFLDGRLARSLNASTFFGSLYDGIADKAFLAINFIILCSLTPWAILPILLEIGIMGVQYSKYKKNLNIKSNLFGKAKMWIAGISVVLANFLIDIEKIDFLGTSIINKINSLSDSVLVEKALFPIIMAEMITLVSYILECFKKEPDQEQVIEEPNIKETAEIEKIKEEKKKIKQKQEELYSLKYMLFDHEFYESHKNETGLHLLRERAKKK